MARPRPGGTAFVITVTPVPVCFLPVTTNHPIRRPHATLAMHNKHSLCKRDSTRILLLSLCVDSPFCPVL
uniref:Uncharacterized protein n=1 Tax=Anopheles quadriannulatus TaxID=34691 RepID=A0A182WSL3_ANOQN